MADFTGSVYYKMVVFITRMLFQRCLTHPEKVDPVQDEVRQVSGGIMLLLQPGICLR